MSYAWLRASSRDKIATELELRCLENLHTERSLVAYETRRPTELFPAWPGMAMVCGKNRGTWGVPKNRKLLCRRF